MVATASLVRTSPDFGPMPRTELALPLDFDLEEHPGVGMTPQLLVSIFRLAEDGFPALQCDTFKDLLESDGTLRDLFEHRAQEGAAAPYTLSAVGGDGLSEEAAAVLAAELAALAMPDTFEHLIDESNRGGYGVSEIDWDAKQIDGRWWIVPVNFADVPSRRFCLDVRTDELKLTTVDHFDGIPLPPGKMWINRRRGTLARAGLMRTAAWYALFKRYGTRDWVVFAEKFGIPLPIFKYKTGETDVAKSIAVAEKALKQFGKSGGAVLPDTVEHEIVESGKAGGSQGVHGSLIEFCNREMSKLVSGGTLAGDNAGSGGASYALGNVHAVNKHRKVVSDVSRLSTSFGRCVVLPFMAYNSLRGKARPPVLELHVVRDQSPKEVLASAETMRNKMGIEVSTSQLRRVTGVQAPLDKADSAPGAAKPAAPPAPGGGEKEAA